MILMFVTNQIEMRFRHALILASIILLGLGCRRDKFPTYPVNPEILRYCLFPSGSYWIYEEASTPGWRDTVVSSRFQHETAFAEGESFYFESYSYDLKIKGLMFRQGVQQRPWKYDDDQSVSFVAEFYSDSSRELHDYLLFMNPDGSTVFETTQKTRIVNTFDSLKLHGKTYSNVIEVETSPISAAGFTFNSLWCKDVGVIRRSLVNGEVWELVEYHHN